MLELAFQKLVCDVVNNDMGGFARKLSHRHLVGIPDLLVKIPRCPVTIIEVKRDKYKVVPDSYKIAATVPQVVTLRKMVAAHMWTGYMSLVLRDRSYGVALVPGWRAKGVGNDLTVTIKKSELRWSHKSTLRENIAVTLEEFGKFMTANNGDDYK